MERHEANKQMLTFLDCRNLGFPLLQKGTVLVLDGLPLLALLLVLPALALLYVTSRAARGRGIVRDTADGDEGRRGAKQDGMLVLGDEVLDAVDDALGRRGGGHGGWRTDALGAAARRLEFWPLA